NEQAMNALIKLTNRPSAIISFNDYVTLDAMNTVRNKGLIVNQDIYFISYANYPIWKYMENPPMASIEQFPGKQGALASQMLFELMDHNVEGGVDEDNIEGQRIVLKSKLVNQHL